MNEKAQIELLLKTDCVKRITEVKNKGKWTPQRLTTNPLDVYKELSQALINKKINQCKYIKSIKRVQLYNGYIKVYVTYNNEVRNIYQIESN